MLNEEQTKQVLSELNRNGKISAVKKYRAFTSASLLDAKSAVEKLVESGGQTEISGDSWSDKLDDSQMDLVLDAIQEGNKVLAVKHYRNATGNSLRESKISVEALMAELEVADPDAVGGRGCVLVVLMIGLPLGCLYFGWL